MIGIYKITNPDGAIYVGQSVDIERRFKAHKSGKYNNKCTPKLCASFDKFGHESHVFEIITKCHKSQLNELERHYQEFYNANSDFNLNCNLTATKDKKGIRRPISDEQKLSISKVHKGKVYSEETRNKIKAARANQVITDEHRRKISENSASAKIVLHTTTGVFFSSAKEAAKAFGIKPNSLVGILIGRTKKNNTNLIYV